jgi:hypothetical protein
MSSSHRSTIWVLVGLTGSTAGTLALREERLRVTVHGRGALAPRHLRKLERSCGLADLARSLDAGEEVLLFDEPRGALRITFPWITFGGGMDVRTPTGRLRLSFLQPANTQVGVVAAGGVAAGRAEGRRWRQLLQA